MTELHLVLLLVNTNGTVRGYEPSGRITVRQVKTEARPGTYCRYEQGVVIYEPKITIDCPQVFKDPGGHVHVRRVK